MSIAAPGVAPVARDHPVTFDVDYPDRPLNRWSSGLRPFAALPILALLALVLCNTGLLVLPVAAMLVVRQTYPRWWFDFNVELSRLIARVGAYLLLLDDRYPSTEAEQAVRLHLPYPDARQDLGRWRPLVKWLLALPHLVALVALWLSVIPVVVYAWGAILVTGRYPRGAFDHVVGVMRWSARVAGYALLLATDEYPPFSLR